MFTQEVINGFEMIHRVATAEIPANTLGCRAFVGVYPPLPVKRISKWRVRKFEIREDLLDKWFSEEDLTDSHFVTVDTLNEVEELLNQRGFADVRFEPPWKNDWPL